MAPGDRIMLFINLLIHVALRRRVNYKPHKVIAVQYFDLAHSISYLFSNGSVCGAMLGCKLGFSALPEDLLKFPNREWLDKQVSLFLKSIGLD